MSDYVIAGQAKPAASTTEEIIPSTTKSFITSGLIISNTDTNSTNVNSMCWVYLVPDGVTLADKHTIVSRYSVTPFLGNKNPPTILAGLVIPAKSRLVVKSDTGFVAFTLTGVLI